MREFLKELNSKKGLNLDKEIIDTICTENGRLITEAKGKTQELENKVKEYESKIEELNSKANDNTKIQEELNTLKKKIADEKAEQEKKKLDDNLTKNILEAISDKEFVNDRTKNSIVSEIKNALQDKANVGKSAKEIFDNITKDSTDIFKKENEVDMSSINEDLEEMPSKKEGIKLNPMFKSFN